MDTLQGICFFCYKHDILSLGIREFKERAHPFIIKTMKIKYDIHLRRICDA